MAPTTAPIVPIGVLAGLVLSYIRECEKQYAPACEQDFREAVSRQATDGERRAVCLHWLAMYTEGRN